MGVSRDSSLITLCTAAESVYVGCCWAGLLCQLAGCQGGVTGARIGAMLHTQPRAGKAILSHWKKRPAAVFSDRGSAAGRKRRDFSGLVSALASPSLLVAECAPFLSGAAP